MRPLTAYTHFRDFNVGDFVLVRDLMILILFPFKWEEQRVMLSRMKRVNILKW
jgi:hypothetical protein